MIRNLTPHPVAVWPNGVEDGQAQTFPPEPQPARLAEADSAAEPLDGLPCVARGWSAGGLPEPVAGITLVVALPLLMHESTAARTDLVAPDTGRGAVRDAEGRIIAVRGFVRRVEHLAEHPAVAALRAAPRDEIAEFLAAAVCSDDPQVRGWAEHFGAQRAHI